MKRRKFILNSSGALSGLLIANSLLAGVQSSNDKPKKKLAVVGTGIRFITMWGKPLLDDFKDLVEFVGLCDTNAGRLLYAKKSLGVSCPTYTDFEQMMKEVKPDTLIVTSPDYIHHQHIIRGMQMGADIITEKPITTNEINCAAILEAEKTTGKKITVAFNYRYSAVKEKIFELLSEQHIGDIKSVDFNYYLDVYHGADYFRRWHRLKANSGTLLVHKSTHHFDLLNWWLNSEPEEVIALGKLDIYGKNGLFRNTHCRTCTHKAKCNFYFDISQQKQLVDLYVNNEQFDNYLRDGCVYRADTDIYDQMSAQIKYANGVNVSYSLTAAVPYEGYRIAFNGTEGRLDAFIKEAQPWHEDDYDEIVLSFNFEGRRVFKIPKNDFGHGGGDTKLKNAIFNPTLTDKFHQKASIRDGIMSVLTGIAATKSIESGLTVKIKDLTTLLPLKERIRLR